MCIYLYVCVCVYRAHLRTTRKPLRVSSQLLATPRLHSDDGFILRSN